MSESTSAPRENRMGTEPVRSLLAKMAVPMMLSMMVQALYNVVDSIFVAKISEDALTAVSLGFPMQNLIISFAVGLGVGMNALLSRALGEHNKELVNDTARQGLFLELCAAALFVFMIGRFIGSWIMRRVAAETMLTLCAVGSVACMVLVMLNIKGLSLAALIANYLFEAIMFPTIFSLTLDGLGRLTKSASSILMMTPVGGCGFLLMGLIADRTDNFLLPFFIPLIGFAIVLAYAMRKRAFLKKA